MKKYQKAIIFCPKIITFVRRDREMLQEYYEEVEIKVLNTSNSSKTIQSLFQLFFFSLFKIKEYDLVASWFVGYHSLFPFWFAKFYNIKTIAFLGGTECHNIPELDHGNFRKNPYAWFTRKSLLLANYLLPVHETLIKSEIDYVPLKFKKQGFLEFTKGVSGHIEALHCGFEKQKVVAYNTKIPKSFLSVSASLSGKVAKRKGIDFVIELAQKCPEYQFTIVGGNYKGPSLKNLQVISAIPYKELIDIYCRHQFYIQFSIAEGFPNALAESMIYGCIPLGSSVFGIPDIIADTGFILQKKDLKEAEALLRKVVLLNDSEKKRLSKLAENRVEALYSPQMRSSKFKDILNL